VVELRVVWIVGVQAIQGGYSITEKIYIFICIGLIKIYILFMNPNQPYDEMYML
jgi:hypothetical protein